MSDNASLNSNLRIQPKHHVVEQAISSCKSFSKRLTARMPMKELQTSIETKNEMRRTLNWVQLTGIGLGAIIGAGIFQSSGQAAARSSGPAVIISFIISGIAALLAALSFSEMAAMMPSSGSAYTYTYIALGEYCAWIVACNLTLIYQLAASTIVVSWSKYVVSFISLVSNYNITGSFIRPPLGLDEHTVVYVTGGVIDFPAVAITVALTILLITGIRQTTTVNLVFVVLKILALLTFIFACCKYINGDNYKPFFPPNEGSFDKFGVTGVLKGSTTVFFAYIGFESVAAAAQEAEKPTRTLPISIIGSLIISMLLYLGVCTVMVGLVPYNLLDVNNPLSEAITATPYGIWLLIIMDLGAIAGLTTVILTLLLSQTRIFYAMAHNGLLPPIFAKIHSRTKTPWISILISGIFCGVTGGICPVDIIGETTSTSALVTYLFVHISVIVMRYTHRDMPRGFRIPFGDWLIPTLGASFCLLLMGNASKAIGIRFVVYMGIGHIIYFSYGFWHSKRRPRNRGESITSMTYLAPTFAVVSMNNTLTDSTTNSINETSM